MAMIEKVQRGQIVIPAINLEAVYVVKNELDQLNRSLNSYDYIEARGVGKIGTIETNTRLRGQNS